MNSEFYSKTSLNHSDIVSSSTGSFSFNSLTERPESSTIWRVCGKDYKTLSAVKTHLIDTLELYEGIIRFIIFSMEVLV